MHNFYYYSPTQFYFGRNAEENVGEALKKDGASHVLLHYGQQSVVKSGLLDRVKQSLSEAGLSYVELGGAQPNPRSELVIEGAELCRKEKIDYLLSIGGGSALDSAKAMAILAPSQASLLDLFLLKEKVTNALPLATVMTFPATGSEASASTVINFTEERLKYGFSSPLIRPRLAFLNPELSYTLPAFQTFCGVADMMSHIMERYFNESSGTTLTDRWSEALLREIIQSAYTIQRDPYDYNARASLMWASTQAHIGLLGLGVEKEDWASHRIEHQLSLVYDVPHGAGLAVVFPNWMRYVLKHKPAKLAQFAREVFGLQAPYHKLEHLALEGIYALQRFFRSCGLPLTLQELGASVDDMPLFLETLKTDGEGLVGNYLRLSKSDCEAIYHLCAEPCPF